MRALLWIDALPNVAWVTFLVAVLLLSIKWGDGVKRKVEQGSLFAFPSLAKAEPEPVASAAPVDAPEQPKLRLVHAVADLDVTFEMKGDDCVELVVIRPNGSSRMGVLLSEDLLEKVCKRAPGALALLRAKR